MMGLSPRNQKYMAADALMWNLYSIPCKPFVLWGIRREHILKMVDGRLCIAFCFDVVSHMWLAKQCGVEMGFSSKAEATRLLKKFGRASVPTWGDRALTYRHEQEQGLILGGHLTRLLNDLSCPVSLVQFCRGEAPITEQRLKQFQVAVRLSMTRGK